MYQTWRTWYKLTAVVRLEKFVGGMLFDATNAIFSSPNMSSFSSSSHRTARAITLSSSSAIMSILDTGLAVLFSVVKSRRVRRKPSSVVRCATNSTGTSSRRLWEMPSFTAFLMPERRCWPSSANSFSSPLSVRKPTDDTVWSSRYFSSSLSDLLRTSLRACQLGSPLYVATTSALKRRKRCPYTTWLSA